MKSKPNRSRDISVIITAHAEGKILRPALESARMSVDSARAAGFTVETVVVLDTATDETREIARTHSVTDRIIELKMQDPSLSRNAGIASTRSRWVCVMDGDNLISQDWLKLAAQTAQSLRKENVILHPELELNFDSEFFVRENVSQLSDDFSPWVLVYENYWDLISFADRRVYESTPYRFRGAIGDLSFGFEDWSWNVETIRKGLVHLPVPGTFHFKRNKKQGSLNQQDKINHAIPHRSIFWTELATRKSNQKNKSTVREERKTPVLDLLSAEARRLSQLEPLLIASDPQSARIEPLPSREGVDFAQEFFENFARDKKSIPFPENLSNERKRLLLFRTPQESREVPEIEFFVLGDSRDTMSTLASRSCAEKAFSKMNVTAKVTVLSDFDELLKCIQRSSSPIFGAAESGMLARANWFSAAVKSLRKKNRDAAVFPARVIVEKDQKFNIRDCPATPRSREAAATLLFDTGKTWPGLWLACGERAKTVAGNRLQKIGNSDTCSLVCDWIANEVSVESIRGTWSISSETENTRKASLQYPTSLFERDFSKRPMKQTADDPLISESYRVIELLEEVWEFAPKLHPKGPVYPRMNFPSVQTENNHQSLARIFLSAVDELGFDLDYLFVIHQLRKGGAELEVLFQIQTILKYFPSAQIGLALTEFSDPDWQERVPPQVKVFQLGREMARAGARQRDVDLVKALMLQLRARRIHVVCATAGWRAYKDQSEVLARSSRLYASLFCIDFTDTGVPISNALDELPDCMTNLSAVFSDNQYLADQVKNYMGYPLNVLHYPSSFSVDDSSLEKILAKRTERSPRFLWASRIAPQKNIELLFEVARLLPQFKFDVYGEFSFRSTDHLFREMKGLENLAFLGGFDGLRSIDTSRYRAFVYTSLWDGLPNILLEAASLKLPIVTTPVGGIPELITNERGYIAQSAREFKTAILRIVSNPDEANQKSRNLQEYIQTQHSLERFENKLRSTEGYIRGP